MSPTVKTGLVLGLAVELWTIIVIALGWHKDPMMLMLFYLVIFIQAGVMIWGLRMTAAQGKGYGAQVGAGTAMSAVGAAVIFVGSYLVVTAVFPNYFMEVQEAGRTVLSAQGLSEEAVRAQLDAMAPMQTPFANSLTGAVATIITGLIESLIIAAFVKGKAPVPPSAA
ncbi:MAG: DUF4199 domain-containing protein [Bacteroidota bacterium]